MPEQREYKSECPQCGLAMTLTVETDVQGIAVSAVRVFMERVEERINASGEWRASRIVDAMEQELAEMEKE